MEYYGLLRAVQWESKHDLADRQKPGNRHQVSVSTVAPGYAIFSRPFCSSPDAHPEGQMALLFKAGASYAHADLPTHPAQSAIREQPQRDPSPPTPPDKHQEIISSRPEIEILKDHRSNKGSANFTTRKGPPPPPITSPLATVNGYLTMGGWKTDWRHTETGKVKP